MPTTPTATTTTPPIRHWDGPPLKATVHLLGWHRAGVNWSASGYGAKIASRWIVTLPDGRRRRIYITQYSNAGSAWITLDGQRVYLSDADLDKQKEKEPQS